MHGVAVVRFTHELSQWEPETFVRDVLVDWLHVAEVWVGANFLFGRDRAGNFSLLRTLGQRYGFRAEKIDPVRYRDFVVSSTRVRRLISRGPRRRGGRPARPPLLHRRHGGGRGRRGAARSGFPTANLDHRQRAVAAARRLCDDRHHRRHRPCARLPISASRPTFGDAAARDRRDPCASDSTGPVRRARCGSSFVQRLRDERTLRRTWTRWCRRSTPTARSAQAVFDRLSL